MSGWRSAIDHWIEERAERWIEVRRHLHRYPEPSREEFETTRDLAGQLVDAGP